MTWVNALLVCFPIGERGNLGKVLYYWNTEGMDSIPSNDVIEMHVWGHHMTYGGITFSSFYVLPMEMIEDMTGSVTTRDISDDVLELGNTYGGNNW